MENQEKGKREKNSTKNIRRKKAWMREKERIQGYGNSRSQMDRFRELDCCGREHRGGVGGSAVEGTNAETVWYILA